MRGTDDRTGSLFSYVDIEARIRRDHPLRVIREIANAALLVLDGDFAELYAHRFGRPSIPPERLLRAMLLQAIPDTLRSNSSLLSAVPFHSSCASGERSDS